MTKNKFFWIVLLSLTALGLFFFFRLPFLNNLPVFVDEAIYVRWSQVMRSEPSLRFLPLSDGKQPLYMWITIPFLKVISDPLLAGRLVSVAAGLGSLIGIGVLAFVIFSDFFIAIFSSLIYAIIPFTMFFDRMALADSLLAMFGVWSLVWAIQYAKTKKTEYAMYLGFAIGGGLLTKSPGFIYYVWALLAIVFFGNIKAFKKISLAKLFWDLFLVFAISQAMYAILRLGTGFQMIGARNQDYVYSIKEVLSHPLTPLTDNLLKTANWLFLLFTPTVLLLGALGFLNQKARKNYLFLILISLIPLILQAFIAKVYTSRYILFAIYPLIPLTALGLHWLFVRKGILIKASVCLFLAVPLLFSYLYLVYPALVIMPFDMRSGYLEEWSAGWGQKEIAQYLIDEESKGKTVVVFTEGFFGTLPDGLQIYTEGHKDITIVGSTHYVSAIPQGLLDTDPRNERFFIFNQSRNFLNQADLDKMELIKEYPKAVRSDGTRDSLLFYRLK